MSIAEQIQNADDARKEIENDFGAKVATPPEFKESLRPWFKAEVATRGDDLVFHFFLPKVLLSFKPEDVELAKAIRHLWEEGAFPFALDLTARNHFNADRPRLAAQFVHDCDLYSWWFVARGFKDHVIMMEPWIERFYDRINAVVQASCEKDPAYAAVLRKVVEAGS